MTERFAPAVRRELIVAEQQRERALVADTPTTPVAILSEAAIAADLERRRNASLPDRIRTAVTTRPTMPVPIVRATERAGSAIAARRADSARIARNRERVRAAKRSGLAVLTVAFVMAVTIVTTIPAQSLVDPAQLAAGKGPLILMQSLPPQELQVLTGGADTAVSRDTYSVESIRKKLAVVAAGRSAAFTNDPSGTIQWPFVYGVPMSDQFGPRVLCDTCGVTMHNGADFLPGRGAPIQAIADGRVRYVEESDDGLGVHVIIDHQIDGELVSSVYCHMEFGSVPLSVGDQVRVGELVGTVGDTGFAFGPHLHFEIRLGGTDNVDPVAWLRSHAN
ncbi:M23 family metallopeptidase [Naasia lichenicola]|uniref:M23 family metallopeptidase n=1 Tax=Naasia lichenicola TaxID=2565933 RepID=A0A4S4FMK0_9MICO|nr:M23 family metallopeptidase [Naasia lichenicola]THG31042.1 M23 family metallopeptidase [Naasia lichenicola]